MIRKVKIHLVFTALLYTIYIVCSFIYNRSLSDLFLVFLYYVGIASIVLSINHIMNRKIRWSIFLFVFILPITYFIFIGTNAPYSSSLEVLVSALPINLPFSPSLYSFFQERVIPPMVIYILCFLAPLIYFYSAYFLSKMIFKNKTEI
jgi:hypothetical protein